jgi:hypothetical protein
MQTWIAGFALVIGICWVSPAPAAPRPARPTKATKPAAPAKPVTKPTTATGPAAWDGMYAADDARDGATGLLCPGDGPNTSQYTVTKGMLAFDVRWIDEERGHRNGPRTFHVSAPLVPLDAKTVKQQSDYATSMAKVSAKVPIAPITVSWDGEDQVFREALVTATFSNLDPQGEAQAMVGTGRSAEIHVSLGVIDPVNGAAAACGGSRINSQSFQQNDFSKGQFCARSGSSCTWNEQCCSKSCSSERHEVGVCN